MPQQDPPAKPHEIILGLIILGFLAYLIFTKVLPAIGGFAGGFFNSSAAKEYCGQSHKVVNAKTNAAAKLAYKSCLKSWKN